MKDDSKKNGVYIGDKKFRDYRAAARLLVQTRIDGFVEFWTKGVITFAVMFEDGQQVTQCNLKF